MNISRLAKTLFVGALLFTAGALGQKNLCSQQSSRALCEGNWGIPRSNMPQIVDETRARYLDSLPADRLSFERIEPHRLTPIQSEINSGIVYKLVKIHKQGGQNPCDFPILVARNETHDSIIDGHHTRNACWLLGGQQLAIVIRDFASRVFEDICNFPGVFRIGLSGRRV
ncbi:MAG: hypothetical protein K1X28_09740 [Parachlamydiales bacterium]|nr:hypothetical protein [Parachlamydiales bacterium]